MTNLYMCTLAVAVSVLFIGIDPLATSSTETYEGDLKKLNANFKQFKLANVSVVGPRNRKLTIFFSVFGQEFELNLHHESKKGTNVTVVSKYGPRSYIIEPSYFSGSAAGSASSFVHGVLENATFSGSIHDQTKNHGDIIYIEPLCYFIKEVKCSNVNSVVYKRSDVIMSGNVKTTMRYRTAPQAANRLGRRHFQKTGRSKRAERATSSGTICQVYFVVDHTFYQEYTGSNPSATLTEVCYFMSEASKAFEDTDFDGDGPADKIGFDLKGMIIYETEDAAQYKMGGSLNVEDYLEVFSEYDFGSYCLAAAFTHRDFADGVIGLAWLGYPSSANKAGGICQPRLVYLDGDMSYNTLLVSSINYGNTLSKAVISLTLTHEFGHSFGANHDDDNDAVCSPSDAAGGKYLMHPYSTATHRPNNFLFSPCSRNQINPVIADKSGCFAAKKEPFCGDGMIDEDEECDCGPEDTCDEVDPCCNPTGCTLKAGKVCTPLDVTKPCCTPECNAASATQLCSLGGECIQDALCDGSSAACPTPLARPNGTFCYGNTAVCELGSCSLSVCSLLGLELCQCIENERDLCVVCCKTGSGECIPAPDADTDQTAINTTIPSMPGQACNDYHGFCDDEQTCVKTGKKGAQDRLNQFLRGNMWKRWFANYGLFAGIGAVALFVSGIALKTIYKKKKMSKSPAYNLAKVALLWQEANKQYEELVSRLERLQTEYKSFIEDEFIFNYSSMTEDDFLTSAAKLSLLFPDIPDKVIRKRVKRFNTEEQAVEKFIQEGHGMRKIL